jgi:hypothetical protein
VNRREVIAVRRIGVLMPGDESDLAKLDKALAGCAPTSYRMSAISRTNLARRPRASVATWYLPPPLSRKFSRKFPHADRRYIVTRASETPGLTMRVRIDHIHKPRRLGPLHRPRVRMYRDMIRARQKLPPLEVIRFGRGLYELQEGYHRLAALRAEGRKYVDVRIIVD